MKKQLITEIENVNYIMQIQDYLSNIIRENNISFVYSIHSEDPEDNHAYNLNASNRNVDKVIHYCEEYYNSLNRISSFFISPLSKPSNLLQRLINCGYQIFEEEAWMFFDINALKEISHQPNVTLELVNQNTIDNYGSIYAKVFGLSEGKNISDKFSGRERLTYPLVKTYRFIAYYKETPVGILTLYISDNYAGIYAVATEEKYRGMGIASVLIKNAVQVGISSGAKKIFLQTSLYGNSQIVFERIGFRTQFVRCGLLKII
jgi:GNAT superfamily N-acetyltransferase